MPQGPSPDPQLGPALKRLREKAGLSQEQLGHRAHLTAGAISKIETGVAGPSWATVMQIIDALDVTLAQLARAISREPK